MINIFLDDIRNPEDCVTYMHKRIGALNPIYINEKWLIVRNYEQFKEAIFTNVGKIRAISFDHDLGEDEAEKLVEAGLSKRKARAAKKQVKSGYDCAVYFKKLYDKSGEEYPLLFVHSMNPVGTENIINLFK